MTTVGIPPEPAEIPVNSIRQQAERRQFVLGRSEPGVQRVSAAAFWAIWRDGGNEMMHRSAQLAQIFREAGEEIMFLAEAERAAPPNIIGLCLAILEDAQDTPDGRLSAVPTRHLDLLRQELTYHGYLKGDSQ